MGNFCNAHARNYLCICRICELVLYNGLAKGLNFKEETVNPPSPGQTIFLTVSFQSLSHLKSNMAESDEEVDVEDVSDGEQTNNLRGLGDDDQKDKWCGNVLGFICNNFSY